MRHFPAFLDLAGRRALVLGTGEIGHRKAEALARAGAEVVMRDAFDPADLAGCAIAIGADANEADLAALSRVAQARGIPVNVVDRPALCTFTVPATLRRGDLTIAIATEGRCPALAGILREELAERYGPEFAELAGLFGEARKKMIELGWDGRRIRETLAGIYRAGDRRALEEFLTRRACGGSSSSGTSS